HKIRSQIRTATSPRAPRPRCAFGLREAVRVTATLATAVHPRYPAPMRGNFRLLLPLLALLPLAVGQTPKSEPEPLRIPPKSPAESLKAFEVAPGFRVELVASEPLVQSPMACDWDDDGRLYVL